MTPKPQHSGPTFGRGSAAKQQARKEAHIQPFRDKLAEVQDHHEQAAAALLLIVCGWCAWERIDRQPETPLRKRRCGSCGHSDGLRREALDGSVVETA